MIGQPKHQNQPNRECLYAWYPEVNDDNVYTTLTDPRDIYLHSGIDKDLLEDKSSLNRCKNSNKKKSRYFENRRRVKNNEQKKN